MIRSFGLSAARASPTATASRQTRPSAATLPTVRMATSLVKRKAGPRNGLPNRQGKIMSCRAVPCKGKGRESMGKRAARPEIRLVEPGEVAGPGRRTGPARGPGSHGLLELLGLALGVDQD